MKTDDTDHTKGNPDDGEFGELMSPEDLAKHLRVPLGTIYAWRSRRVLPRPLKIGKHIRYRRSTIRAWLKQIEKEGENDEKG